MTKNINLIGPITDTDKDSLSRFLGHDCMTEGEWAKFTRTNCNFEFAICSNGNHFIRLKRAEDKLNSYRMKEVTRYIEKFGYIFVSGFTALHALVARAFLPDYMPYPEKEVNHKDGNKFNNDISNLEMVTHKENVDHFWHDPRLQHKREEFTRNHTGTNHWTEKSLESFRQKMKNFKHTDESKAKMSAVHKGKKLSEEHIIRIKAANTGNKNVLGLIHVTNGCENHTIAPKDLELWEAKGFKRGFTIFNPPKPGTKKPYQHTKEFIHKKSLQNKQKGGN